MKIVKESNQWLTDLTQLQLHQLLNKDLSSLAAHDCYVRLHALPLFKLDQCHSRAVSDKVRTGFCRT